MRTNNIFKLIGVAIAVIFTASSASAQAKPLKLISYNILKGMETDTTTGKTVFVEWVKEQNPDVLAIQEANYFTQKSLEELAASYGHPYAVLLREKGYPTAITSKTPIVMVDKVIDNMWHGFIACKVAGYNMIILHLSPHVYTKRQEEIQVILETVKASGEFKNWMIMGDFNSLSPLDKSKYADGKYAERLRAAELKYPNQKHLNNGELDFSVQQAVLDFGFVDSAREDKNFTDKDFGGRIDYIYVSPDLRRRIASCGFIKDDFTKKYSDHRPVLLNLKAK